MTQRAREKRRWRRARQESQVDRSAAAALFENEALRPMPCAIGLLHDLGRILSRPADVSVWRIPEGKYGASAFAWAWTFSTLVGLCGVLAYAFPIGRRYFNFGYLMLIPVSASLVGFLVLAGSRLALKYLYGRPGYSYGEVGLCGPLALCFFWVPLTYLVFPLRLFEPRLERHPLWVAIPLSVLAAVMVARAKSPLFRRRDFGVGYVAVAVPLFTAYGLGPNMARVLVELFRL